jgi:hypothetical protein
MQNILSSSLQPKKGNNKVYRIIILPVALYGYENWSLILREDYRLRVLENRVLRKIYGPRGTRQQGVENTA